MVQSLNLHWLVLWNIWTIFPYIGNVIIPFDFHIFQRGSNHQPVMVPHGATMAIADPAGRMAKHPRHLGPWPFTKHQQRHTAAYGCVLGSFLDVLTIFTIIYICICIYIYIVMRVYIL